MIWLSRHKLAIGISRRRSSFEDNIKSECLVSKAHVFSRQKAFKEIVDAHFCALHARNDAVCSRLTINNGHSLIGSQEVSYRALQPSHSCPAPPALLSFGDVSRLVDIVIRRWLVKEIIFRFARRYSHCKSLGSPLSCAMSAIKIFCRPSCGTNLSVTFRSSYLQQFLWRPFECLWYEVDELRFDRRASCHLLFFQRDFISVP